MKKYFLIAVSVVLILFVVQNTQVTSIQFLVWELSMSRVILYPLIFFMGAVSGYAIFCRKQRRG